MYKVVESEWIKRVELYWERRKTEKCEQETASVSEDAYNPINVISIYNNTPVCFAGPPFFIYYHTSCRYHH